MSSPISRLISPYLSSVHLKFLAVAFSLSSFLIPSLFSVWICPFLSVSHVGLNLHTQFDALPPFLLLLLWCFWFFFSFLCLYYFNCILYQLVSKIIASIYCVCHIIKKYIWSLTLAPDTELQKPLEFPEWWEYLLLFITSPFKPEIMLLKWLRWALQQ